MVQSDSVSTAEKLSKIEDEIENVMPYLGLDEKNSALKETYNLSNIDADKSPKPNVDIQIKVKEVKPWIHFVAGGIGGMAGAIATCPLDVVKTRLQSDVYHQKYKSSIAKSNHNAVVKSLQHFGETFGIIGSVYRTEGFRALFKGLGPNLVGVIPARSINFFTYGITKQFLSKNFNNNNEATWIQLISAGCAGIATSTATNPIWLVKTRMQLDANKGGPKINAIQYFISIYKKEGIPAFYKGLTASYLGSLEGVIQWVLYEQMKSFLIKKEKSDTKNSSWNDINAWMARSGAAGFAKFIASMVTYPHEVVRTRLRQAPTENGKLKYTGIVQSFSLIVKEEGLASMYSGLTPHLLRTIPNNIIMFGTWEILMTFLSENF